jgi:hypothetical protein
MTIEEINSALDDCLCQLFRFNPELRIVFTVSPVRHIRDGIIDNNRSKARLIESVHHLVNKFDRVYYFPAYELVIDVLRDYRYFDIDLVHPNYQATEFVFEKFVENFIEEEDRILLEEIKKIVVARKHKPFHSSTAAHQLFLKTSLQRVTLIQQKHPQLDLTEEIEYFSSQVSV